MLVDPEQHQHFKRLLAESGCKTEFLDTEDALELIAAHEQVDVVMAAIVGAAGLASGLAAVSPASVCCSPIKNPDYVR